jgi:magnesium-transporting ATPase (P-type)
LGINIYEAVLNGTNVEVSLDDLLSGMKDIKTTIEKSKRANREAFNMVKFFVPIVYILSIFLAIEYFGFTFEKFLYFQFRTGLGIKLFIVIIAIWVVSYFLTYLLSKPKFDY